MDFLEVGIPGGLSQAPTIDYTSSQVPSASSDFSEVEIPGGLCQASTIEYISSQVPSASLDFSEVETSGGLSQASNVALDDHGQANSDCQALRIWDVALDDHGQANGDCQALRGNALDDHGQANGDCQALNTDCGEAAGKRIWESWVENSKRSTFKRKIDRADEPVCNRSIDHWGPKLPYNVDEDMLCRSIEACKLPTTVEEITNSFGKTNLNEISFNLMYKRPKTGGLNVPTDWNPFASLQTISSGTTIRGNTFERSMMDEVGPAQHLGKAKPIQSLKFGRSLPKELGDGHLGLDG